MDEESKSLKINGLLPVSVLVGTITYTLSLVIYVIIILFEPPNIPYSEISGIIILSPILFIGFLGPVFVYIKSIKGGTVSKVIIGISAFLFLYPEFFLIFFLSEFFSINLDFALIFSFISIPLSFMLGTVLPTKTHSSSKIFSIDVKKLIILTPVFWLSSWFGFPLLILMMSELLKIKLNIDPVFFLIVAFAPLVALISSLNLELLNYIASKIFKAKML